MLPLVLLVLSRPISSLSTGSNIDPPKGIQSRTISPHEVELSWEALEAGSTIFGNLKYRVQCAEEHGQMCFQTKFTDELSICISDLEAFSDYTAEISTCADNHRCGKSIPHTFSTPAGCPSVPRSLKAVRTRGIISISWQPPENFEGFLDGYELAFCLANEEDCPLNDDWHHVKRTQTSWTWSSGDQVTRVVLKAFNKQGPKSLYSDDAIAEIEEETKTSKPPVAMIVTACVVVLGALAFCVSFRYKKWRLQKRDPELIVSAHVADESAVVRIGARHGGDTQSTLNSSKCGQISQISQDPMS